MGNGSAGIRVWYDDNSRRNISLKLVNHKEMIISNSRAELGAILQALRQNGDDKLEIESGSLSSLRAICTHSNKYEDINWLGIRNTDLLKGILIRLRTRPARTSFTWIKGHNENNYGNKRADELANKGREKNTTPEMDHEEWINNHPSLQAGAWLQALKAKQIYAIVVKWHTKDLKPILHQDTIDEAQNKIEEATGL